MYIRGDDKMDDIKKFNVLNNESLLEYTLKMIKDIYFLILISIIIMHLKALIKEGVYVLDVTQDFILCHCIIKT